MPWTMNSIYLHNLADTVMRYATVNGFVPVGDNTARTLAACDFILALSSGVNYQDTDLPNAKWMAGVVKDNIGDL